MKHSRREKNKRNKIIVPVASMGDIAFLLIIFFLVCSNFTQPQVELTSPLAPEVDKLKPSTIVVSIDKEGQIYLNGADVPDKDAIEWGVAALTEGEETREGKFVMFRCDAQVDRKIYEPVLDAIAQGGGIILAIGDEGNPATPASAGNPGQATN